MKKTYQIVILGPGGVGKTRGAIQLIKILNSLGFSTSEIKEWTEDMVVTSNYVIHNFLIPQGYFADIKGTLQVSLYDMGGQFKYQTMWKNLARETDGIICVVDMTRSSTMKQIPIMLPKNIMAGVPVRLLVNKADLFAKITNKSQELSESIYRTLKQVAFDGQIDYKIIYKGDTPWNYGGTIYHYGDTVHILRALEFDEDRDMSIRIADFEVVIANVFRQVFPTISIHNCNLFGREFMLQIFDIIYSWMNKMSTVLSDELIKDAHNEAPPFVAYGGDPEGVIPKMNKISIEAIRNCIDRMLIGDNDLVNMVTNLKKQGYNLHIEDRNSWDFTSAFIEEPTETYKPVHLAMLPPFFIKDVIDYADKKAEEEENEFFI